MFPSLALLGGIGIGFLLSLISWIRIASSGGALTGLGFAITGTILPVVLGVLLVPLVFFQLSVVLMSQVPSPTRQMTILPIVTTRSMELLATLLLMVAAIPGGAENGTDGGVPVSVPAYLMSG